MNVDRYRKQIDIDDGRAANLFVLIFYLHLS